MGTDLHSLGSEEFYGNAFGLGPKAPKGLSAPAQVSTSSAPSDPAERQKIADAVKAMEDGKLASKAAAKAAAKEKAKNMKIWDKKTASNRAPLRRVRDNDIEIPGKKDNTALYNNG